MVGDWGFGIAGALPHEVVRAIAPAVERAGFRTLWVNDTPVGDALASLAVAAEVTNSLRLASGVIPLDRLGAQAILDRLRDLNLPVDRLLLGVGVGRSEAPLRLARKEIMTLKKTTESLVNLGALGPRMSALAGEVADGVLLNWLTPDYAATTAEIVRSAAADTNRAAPRIDGYVRVALGQLAYSKLRTEAERYASYPSYAAHFARMGVQAIQTCVYGETPGEVRAGLAPYSRVLDETVVRAITPEETIESYLSLIDATAPNRQEDSRNGTKPPGAAPPTSRSLGNNKVMV
ncbi:MAG: LLM class flavin-dependent oxidoreductase [Chloroflexota bacterium]|nr:LLM class flavin-dependent oxidoreductase [Chloroflexota bacterium]